MARALTDIRSLARTHSRLAIRVLREVACSKKASDSARVAAAQALLDRGWGKAEQHVDIAVKSADAMSDLELNAEIERLSLVLGVLEPEPLALPEPIDADPSDNELFN